MDAAIGNYRRKPQYQKRRVNLSQYDGMRVAVVFYIQGETRIVRGRASWSHDEVVGNALRIALEDDDPGSPEIVLCESWNGTIEPDTEYGCDVTVRLF